MSKSAFPTLPWERLYFSVPRRHNQCDAQKQKNTLLKYDSPLLVWSWRDSSPGRVVQSMCKYSTGEVAGKLSWKWWDGGPSALWCTKTPLLPEQLWIGISQPFSNSGCCISQNLPLSNKPACPVAQVSPQWSWRPGLSPWLCSRRTPAHISSPPQAQVSPPSWNTRSSSSRGL